VRACPTAPWPVGYVQGTVTVTTGDGELTLRRLFRSYGPDVQSATLSAHLCAMGTLMWATRGQE
jgi:hypothetical protein